MKEYGGGDIEMEKGVSEEESLAEETEEEVIESESEDGNQGEDNLKRLWASLNYTQIKPK